MVSPQHEAHNRASQELSELFTSAFQLVGLPDPGKTSVEVLNCDLTTIEPVERRADTLLRLETADDTYLLIVEAQSKKDRAKARSWGYYLSYLANRFPDEHPMLLVVCRDSRTAKWASGPFRIGHGARANLHVTPFVLGPDNVPVITDIGRASANLPLATFSAVTHSGDPGIGDILKVLAAALSKAADPERTICADIIACAMADTPAAELWRQLMSPDILGLKGFVAEELRDEGRAEGEAGSLLKLLELRGIQLAPLERERITTCQALELLTHWFARAVSAATTAEVFADDR